MDHYGTCLPMGAVLNLLLKGCPSRVSVLCEFCKYRTFQRLSIHGPRSYPTQRQARAFDPKITLLFLQLEDRNRNKPVSETSTRRQEDTVQRSTVVYMP